MHIEYLAQHEFLSKSYYFLNKKASLVEHELPRKQTALFMISTKNNTMLVENFYGMKLGLYTWVSHFSYKN